MNILDFFINAAHAEGAVAPAAPGLAEFLPMILLFVVFYFVLIRPQMKRAKEHKALVEGLNKGDEIVTNGGVLGKITEVGENFVQVEIAANTEIKVQRNAVAMVMPKGTVKSL